MSVPDSTLVSGGELAHALRNPLSSVKIALQSLGREAPGPRTRLALREVRKMERLLAALAEWGRPVTVPAGLFSVSDLLQAAAGDVAEELSVREVRWALDSPPAGFPLAVGEPLRLRPLLAQLLLEVADREPGRAHPPLLCCWDGGAELRLCAPGLARAGAARACVAALDALLEPTGGEARAVGSDLVVLRFAS